MNRSLVRGKYCTALLGLSFALVNASTAMAQYDAGVFRPLAVPTSAVGTCEPSSPRPNAANTHQQSGWRLTIRNRSPSRERLLQVVVDSAGRTRGYSELLTASTGMRSSEGDHIIASIDSLGRVKGFRSHRMTTLPPGPLKAIDTAALRIEAMRAARNIAQVPLDEGDQRRVKAMAEWLRKRCTG